MENPDVIRRLEKLSPRKKEILKCFCHGMSIEQMAEKYFIGKSSVRAHINQIYIKLELDTISVDARRAVLLRLYCEAFEKYVKGSEYKGETAIVDLSPESFEEEAKEEEDMTPKGQKHKKEIDNIIDADHKALIKTKPYIIDDSGLIPIINPPERKPNPFKIGLFIFALIGFAAVAIMVYELLSGGFGILSSITNMENPQEPVAEQPTQAPAVVQVEPTQAIIQPTNTAMQPTAIPTPAPTSPPKAAILFEDDFEKGLSDAWEVILGKPIIVNGKLSTDQDTWLLVGEPGWKNYSVEFLTDSPYGFFWNGFNVIGVRADSIDNMYAYKWTESETEMFIIKNGDWSEVPQTDILLYRSEPMNFRMTVVDNLITLYIDGVKKLSFVDDGFPEGRIALKLFAEATIDNFKVKEILE